MVSPRDRGQARAVPLFCCFLIEQVSMFDTFDTVVYRVSNRFYCLLGNIQSVPCIGECVRDTHVGMGSSVTIPHLLASGCDCPDLFGAVLHGLDRIGLTGYSSAHHDLDDFKEKLSAPL